MISEDIEWDSKYYSIAKKVKLINSTSYFYRSNPNSLSKRFDRNRFNRYVTFYEYMKERLNNLNLGQEALLRLQKYFFVSLEVSVKQTNSLSFNGSIHEIKKISNNKIVRQVVDTYPIDKLPVKQKIFVQVIKNKYCLLMVLMSRIFLR